MLMRTMVFPRGLFACKKLDHRHTAQASAIMQHRGTSGQKWGPFLSLGTCGKFTGGPKIKAVIWTQILCFGSFNGARIGEGLWKKGFRKKHISQGPFCGIPAAAVCLELARAPGQHASDVATGAAIAAGISSSLSQSPMAEGSMWLDYLLVAPARWSLGQCLGNGSLCRPSHAGPSLARKLLLFLKISVQSASWAA